MSCDSTCDISLPGENSATQISSHQNPGKISLLRKKSATKHKKSKFLIFLSRGNSATRTSTKSFFDKFHGLENIVTKILKESLYAQFFFRP